MHIPPALQQSALYSEYLKKIGWQTVAYAGVFIYIRKIPFLGSLAKIQRPHLLPEPKTLIPLLKSYGVRLVAIEPSANSNEKALKDWINTLAQEFKISKSPFLPTKTLLIDLTPETETLFKNLTEAKQRAIRRARKNLLTTQVNQDINTFIRLKSKAAGLFGSITTYGLRQLFETFSPRHTAILLAYTESSERHPIAGIFLILSEKFAYYWIAGATLEGKRLFAPTLLVWEALILAKDKGNKTFDFVGVWDERFPGENNSWKGFTKFKEGFGGKPLYYPYVQM